MKVNTMENFNQMVKYYDQAPIAVKFNQWSGTTGNTYKIYFDGAL